MDQSVVMYADIPGHRFDDAPPSTIPHSLAITPDMVIVSELNRTVQVLELTIPKKICSKPDTGNKTSLNT